MPGINSATDPCYQTGWEMEYDHYQHYFFDDHDPGDDFFKATAPSEDIWKKFELVPTPPMSPVRALEGANGTVYPSLGDKLEWVSQVLGQEDDQDVQCKLSPLGETMGNLSSIIIQDCMWSGFSAGKQLEKVVGERLASCVGPGPTKLGLHQVGANITTGRAQCVAVPVDAGVPVMSSVATDCVDPAAVLTFPLTGGPLRKPAVSSGSESHTDSSDDESSDEDEDEEEIDVVTVEPRPLAGGGLNRRTPVTIMVQADPLDPCMKRFHISIHQQQHNYAAPSPDTHAVTHPDPPRKRLRHEPTDSPQNLSSFSQSQVNSHPVSTGQNSDGKPPRVPLATVGSDSSNANKPSPASSLSQRSSCPRSSSYPSSPQWSDCEDTDKRKTHNFLERKRRNDLRSRFLALRDEIPGLAECPKTPKVAILTRATEYLQRLHSSERQRVQETRQLKARQQQLLRRLAQLKQC
ncbi:protein L-Myc-1b [Esox lucius]|uniref:BHLH domain-containing protein n=1 Tax=Esox lucius TaxID=8010 RepID=A0AAY5JWV5_ESOLU|nr:protein L-Myc-1b [Esox lucius]XP_010871441.4 protein L-Myc-1b [Esox lucius]XP_010871442.4 protein L-Myc-1b [Esox lucius]XP_010871443.4 protein L-Myc-1b [Esox lucius]